MKRILCLLFLFLPLGGCSSKPTPGWIVTGNQQLETFKQHFLTGGQPLVTERHFRKAVEEIKKGGDLDLLGKIWLTRMALEVAALGEIEEEDYLKVAAVQPVPANRNFHLFLTGDPMAVDGCLLPAQYRSFLKALQEGDTVKVEKAVAAMADDPLSQLIAAGLSLRRHPENEAILQTAVSTASRNGWKRTLLAWLDRLQTFYAATGDTAKAGAVRQRIDLIGK
ncbi:MAG: hypothetical protein A2X92_00600 [Syntrophus sp. GWC2_56_31]|nr:MAG: hypothetical protein A2X92_00600 [Syntrophus sp. GWC2_56_31]